MGIKFRSGFLGGALLVLLLGLTSTVGAVVIPTPGTPPSGPQPGPVPHNPGPGPVDPGPLPPPPPPPPPEPEPPVPVPPPEPCPGPPHHTPEPATLVSSLVGAGLLGLHAWRKRRRVEASR